MLKIENLPYFSHLNHHEIEKIKKFCTLKKYISDEILFYEGETPKYLYILLKGTLKVYQTTAKSNHIFILFFTQPGEIIGEFALYADSPYPNTAQFVTEGEVLKINFFPIQKEVLNNPILNLHIIQSLIKKQRAFLNLIHNEISINTEAKVIKFLLDNEQLVQTLKQIEIAAILNTTPETLSRMLSKLKSLGFIHIDKKHTLTLQKKEALQTYYRTIMQN
ncbi:Crp/Fnr family transcriptional regulator [Sulfurospirillum diekertiae]|uniref:Crp/Fnr family transcriptional regulator n=1 Tax=Sulfurospirillum diekertiae TaxID=1854492 RepID=A0A6G9VT83_9BACT|nr:Crp/Fnr family transcriptional regulator [Sulfurospirillum diekertiae]QIR75890.1 Crp/Fnr family transcriptional regulator [Sulfurospirillum diekertiae]QIR78530.1 Crp/Fnr family transcriptional regulator [Sulfurospirillum diekertiae]